MEERHSLHLLIAPVSLRRRVCAHKRVISEYPHSTLCVSYSIPHPLLLAFPGMCAWTPHYAARRYTRICHVKTYAWGSAYILPSQNCNIFLSSQSTIVIGRFGDEGSVGCTPSVDNLSFMLRTYPFVFCLSNLMLSKDTFTCFRSSLSPSSMRALTGGPWTGSSFFLRSFWNVQPSDSLAAAYFFAYEGHIPGHFFE